MANLELCDKFAATPGCVVECGVWRGGMSAGIAEVPGPIAIISCLTASRGCRRRAKNWTVPRRLRGRAIPSRHVLTYNCSSGREEARAAMKLPGASSFSLVKGWFN